MPLKHNVLVLGSQNSKPEDQKITREEVRPVQLLKKDGNLLPVHFFNNWGEVGVSSIVWDNRWPNELFVSINEEIRRLNIKTREFETLELGTIGDLHDIHFLNDGLLWISNTEYDEVIVYDAEKGDVVRRISLDEYRWKLDRIDQDEIEKVKDRFHCNQVFEDYNGNKCVLIHSIHGWLLYRVLFEMLVKKQGEGGVINLETGEVHQLKLQSPHSVRKINGEYWIQDSSDLSTKIFDESWKHIDTIKTGGFGRGVDFSEVEDIAYIGLSATRKRYLKIIPSSEYHSNRILVTTIEEREKLEEIPIPNIEQLDNVYILNERILKIFETLI
jgi:hypothetical protein